MVEYEEDGYGENRSRDLIPMSSNTEAELGFDGGKLEILGTTKEISFFFSFFWEI